MSTPTSYTSAASAPNYSTNVNRSKTKKWVEAKTVDYGGDDWGAGEYDDDDDDDDEPAPPTKPTGLRQKGQAMQASANPVDNTKKSYGDLPSVPGQNQLRSSTASSVPRKNSFDLGDEKRAFSSSGPASTPITSSSGTGQRGSGPPLQISTQPVTGFRKPVSQPSDEQPNSQSATPQAVTASSIYSDDIQTRRDYSPSAVPAPLSAISVSQSSADHFPPRKSSLTQQTRPDLSNRPSVDAAAKPWDEGRAGSPGMPSVRSPTSPPAQKPLPFVRPADIYKRIAEERERERQSLDSSRPSIESLDPGTVSDKNLSVANPPSQGRANAEGSGQTRGDSGAENDTPTLRSSKGLMPILAPVQERKSEYGFDGFMPPNSHSRESSDATQTSRNERIDENRYSKSPELPDFNRMSGFGDDLFSPTDVSHADSSGSNRTPAEETTQEQHQSLLRTEPSLGFRTAVNTAFDNANSVPLTPSSRLGDSLGRSDSESTSTTGISPIMSRAPSGAMAAETRNREAEAREASTPAIAEVSEPESRPQSAVGGTTQVPVTLKEGGVLAEDDDALTPPARPRAERETSFRPTLPGGWNSYATNVSERTVQSDSIEHQEAVISSVSPVYESTDGENQDITPTISKTPLPSTNNFEEAALAGVEASTVGQQQKNPLTTVAAEQPPSQTETGLEAQHTYSPIDVVHDDEDILPKPLNGKTNTNLSTESRPSDDETDRLRKEIVKSLTPINSDMEPTSTSPEIEEAPQGTERDVRESYYLPSEYDNYWNEQDDGTTSEQAPPASSSHKPEQSLDEISSIPPLASRKVAKSPEPRPVVERRFSWEAEGEQVDTEPKTLLSDVHEYSPVVQPPTPTAATDVSKDGSVKDTKATSLSSDPKMNIRPESSIDENNTSGSEAYIGEAALATGGLATATYASKDPMLEKSNPASPAHEDEPVNPLSSSPVYPLEQQFTQTRQSTSTDKNDNSPGMSHTQRLSLSQSNGTGIFTTNTTLKDILKIQNPYDRIRTCGDVQNKLATADTDLSQWLVTLKSENPEYADIDGNYGGSVPFVSSLTRSKFSKALSPSSNTLQQPYYQQYLNASSPTSPQPTSPRPAGNSGGYVPSGSQQGGLSGFSGGGSKITTQQVQAKSKELLHTAGVFGGKGMKAGKGLLAKGKSRFSNRGAGGSDKVD